MSILMRSANEETVPCAQLFGGDDREVTKEMGDLKKIIINENKNKNKKIRKQKEAYQDPQYVGIC